MNCSEIRSLLDDHVDGELNGETRKLVERHLAQCASCRDELDALQSLLDRAGQLDSDIRPPNDLWPAIHARLHIAQPKSRPGWLQLAAAGIALFILSIPLSVWWAGSHEDDRLTAVEAEYEAASVGDQAALARSEDGVLLPRTDLVTAIERHRDVVEDGTLNIFAENMRLLDQAIGEIRSALEENPQDLRLHMLLAARYQQERKLLQKVTRV